MNIGIIGTGNLGRALGGSLTSAGHAVTYGVREPNSADQASVSSVFQSNEVILLAVPFEAIPDVIASAGNIRHGLIVVDCANPVSKDFSGLSLSRTSSAEITAALLPSARVVKSFNCVGAEISADSRFDNGPATMFVAGDDAEAVQEVMGLADDIGYQPLNAGPLIQSRHLESLAWLWISMAYKYGHGGNFAFKVIERR